MKKSLLSTSWRGETSEEVHDVPPGSAETWRNEDLRIPFRKVVSSQQWNRRFIDRFLLTLVGLKWFLNRIISFNVECLFWNIGRSCQKWWLWIVVDKQTSLCGWPWRQLLRLKAQADLALPGWSAAGSSTNPLNKTLGRNSFTRLSEIYVRLKPSMILSKQKWVSAILTSENEKRLEPRLAFFDGWTPWDCSHFCS